MIKLQNFLINDFMGKGIINTDKLYLPLGRSTQSKDYVNCILKHKLDKKKEIIMDVSYVKLEERKGASLDLIFKCKGVIKNYYIKMNIILENEIPEQSTYTLSLDIVKEFDNSILLSLIRKNGKIELNIRNIHGLVDGEEDKIIILLNILGNIFERKIDGMTGSIIDYLIKLLYDSKIDIYHFKTLLILNGYEKMISPRGKLSYIMKSNIPRYKLMEQLQHNVILLPLIEKAKLFDNEFLGFIFETLEKIHPLSSFIKDAATIRTAYVLPDWNLHYVLDPVENSYRVTLTSNIKIENEPFPRVIILNFVMRYDDDVPHKHRIFFEILLKSYYDIFNTRFGFEIKRDGLLHIQNNSSLNLELLSDIPTRLFEDFFLHIGRRHDFKSEIIKLYQLAFERGFKERPLMIENEEKENEKKSICKYLNSELFSELDRFSIDVFPILDENKAFETKTSIETSIYFPTSPINGGNKKPNVKAKLTTDGDRGAKQIILESTVENISGFDNIIVVINCKKPAHFSSYRKFYIKLRRKYNNNYSDIVSYIERDYKGNVITLESPYDKDLLKSVFIEFKDVLFRNLVEAVKRKYSKSESEESYEDKEEAKYTSEEIKDYLYKTFGKETVDKFIDFKK